MSKELIRKIFQDLPPAEKKMPVISINNIVYTWEEVLKEIEEEGELAKKMQEKIEELRK